MSRVSGTDMAAHHGTLIIGASQAGVQLACSLRDMDYDEPVTLVGADRRLPYQRPPLSKALLAGTVEPESLELRSADFFAARKIDVRPGERVVAVDPATRVAVTGSGAELPYGRLALTIGARMRELSIPGSRLRGICGLRDVDDALALRERLGGAERLVVIGGGFIGLEVAATARRRGMDVTVVTRDDRLMGRAVGEATSEFFRGAHTRRGIDLRFGTTPIEFLDDGNGRVQAVVLSDETVLRADVVVVGIGVTPDVELAAALGLQVDNGVVVDEFGVASDRSTVAAGDCACYPCPVSNGTGHMRFESVNTAIEQAKSAASSIVGSPRPYRAIPWFWSDQFDLKLQVAGLMDGYDHTVVRGDPASEQFSALYYRRGRLIAGECVNSARDFMAVKSALAAGRSAPPELVTDIAVSLKSLFAGAAPTPVAAR
ncbi:FAD-dependent oxidoreductase [Streptomyces gardneri]|nr:FAD-dependent oxidoreductase [Streptomyces gardneri]MBF6472561.1 FAD-dependent oxidoreductase [Nocardia abscessus]